MVGPVPSYQVQGIPIIPAQQARMIETAGGFLPMNQLGRLLRRHANPVVLMHFTWTGYTADLQPRLPGVEKVMLMQAHALRQRGYTPFILAGATDCRHGRPASATGPIGDPMILVFPKLASGHYDLTGTTPGMAIRSRYRAEVDALFGWLRSELAGIPVIAHNLSNAARHNPVFGAAVRRWMSQDRSARRLYWLHDFREADPELIELLLPRPTKRARQLRLVSVSEVRKRALIGTLAAAGKAAHLNARRVAVVANPIDHLPFEYRTDLPATLAELAPDFDAEAIGLPPTVRDQDPCQVLFPADGINLVLPARIVHQKHVGWAVKFAQALAQYAEQRVNLVVTGPSDRRKPENVEYFQQVLANAEQINRGGFHCRVYLLQGIGEKYLAEVLARATAVFAPFQNEGWGYVPPEAALARRPVIIAPDPAMEETAKGHCYVLGRVNGHGRPFTDTPLGRVQQEDLQGVLDYVRGNRWQQDAAALRTVVLNDYSLQAVGDRLEQLLRH